MSAKSELDKIEKRIEPKGDEKIDVRVNWRVDDLLEWPLEDGSCELITKEEFKKRGGIIVEWSDGLED